MTGRGAVRVGVLAWLCFGQARAQPAADADASTAPPADAATVPADAAGSPPVAAGPDAAELERAKALFREGNALRKAGDCQRALELYQKSRAIVVGVPNTLNAAYCLEQLGRSAEALELHEDLLTGFADELSPEDREGITAAVLELRPRVGSIEVSANVTGVLVIDGRMRGTLPLGGPVRVMPGRHSVRVIEDGYETFETEVEVEAQKGAVVDARLVRLARAGRLAVEGAAAEGAALYLDGARVGTLPWEGTVAAGEHLYWVVLDDRGTAPTQLTVVEGQALHVAPRLLPLTGELRVAVQPPNAVITIDGVAVGSRDWVGRLPAGEHVFEAREEGYFPERLARDLDAGAIANLVLELRVDEAHPRWHVVEPAHAVVRAFAGVALAPSLGSDAEAFCDAGACATGAPGYGALAGATGAYELPFRLSLELGVGYLWVARNTERSAVEQSGNADDLTEVRYAYRDALRVRGPFAAVGVGYHHPLAERFELEASLHVGAAFLAASDDVTGTATAFDATVDAAVERAGTIERSVALVLLPHVGARWRFDAVHFGAGFATPLVLTPGPDNAHGETRTPPCDPTAPVTCVRRQDTVAAERTYGTFVAVVPQVVVGYTF